MAAGATAGFRYPLPGSPGRFRRGTGITSWADDRVPPRRPKRRPLPKAAAIQRSPRGRDLLLLSFRLGQRPVIHRAHPPAPSSRSRRRLWANHWRSCRSTLTGGGFGSSYESPVTEATRPARLFRGPRNKNRSRYGTRFGCHDPKAARRSYGLVRSERPLRAPPSPTYRQLLYRVTAQRPSTSRRGPARINRFIPFAGDP